MHLRSNTDSVGASEVCVALVDFDEHRIGRSARLAEFGRPSIEAPLPAAAWV